jgi:hypothetical protein
MSKSKTSENQNLMAMAMKATVSNVSKSRSGSGRKTYLDRFVESLLNEKGEPTEPKTRTEVIAEISLDIAQEGREAQIANGEEVEPFELTLEGDSEDDEKFAEINKKVKNQVASAVADNQNSTSVSFNPKYKDVWKVKKEGSFISLASVTEDQIASEQEED